MVDSRSSKDRRVNKDRRKGDISSYIGPKNRGTKQQRIIKNRRNINDDSFFKRLCHLVMKLGALELINVNFLTLALYLKEGLAKIEEVSS